MSQIRQNGTSSSCTIELDDLDLVVLPRANGSKEDLPQVSRRLSRPSNPGRTLSMQEIDREPDGSLPSPSTASAPVERWNKNRTNICKTFAAFWAFIIMGANDAAIGVSFGETRKDMSVCTDMGRL
jgi:hypothetical protein